MLLVGLYCNDSDYRKKLSEVLMEKGGEVFCIYSFSEQDKLLDYCSQSKLDLLLVDESEYGFIRESGFVEEIAKKYILLSEKQCPDDMEEDKILKIHKYMPVRSILELMKKIMKSESGQSCKVIGIASEVHACGKTSLAYQLGQELQGKGQTLLLLMDHRNPLFSSSEKGISSIIYELCKNELQDGYHLLEQGKMSVEKFRLLLKQNVKHFEALTYIPSSDHKQDMEMIRDSHMVALIEYLRALKEYAYIIIDFSDGLLYGDAIASCDVLLCPAKSDSLSESYTSHFQECYPESKRIYLPFVKCQGDLETFYKELQWSSLGGYTVQLLSELIF